MIKSVMFSDKIIINNYNDVSISKHHSNEPNLISNWINYFIILYINDNDIHRNFNSELINKYKENIIFKLTTLISLIHEKNFIKLLPSNYKINSNDICKLNDLIYYLS